MKKLLIIFAVILPALCVAQKAEWESFAMSSFKVSDVFYDYQSSSELDKVDPYEGPGKYGAHNLYDNNPATAWVEGIKGHGEGQYIIIGLGEFFPDELLLYSGYQKSESLFDKNSRPKTIKLSFYTGFNMSGDASEIAIFYRLQQIGSGKTIILEDKMGSQEIELPFSPAKASVFKEEMKMSFKSDFREDLEERKKLCPSCPEDLKFSYFVKIEIIEVYPGSQWDDTCISDIIFFHKDEASETINKDESILQVYEDEDMESGLIYVDTDKRKKIVLIDKKLLAEYSILDEGEFLDLILIDVSTDNEWAQVDFLFSQEGGGRVMEFSVLYNIRYLLRIDESILKTKYGMYGFFEKEGRQWLDTSDGAVDLIEIENKIKSSVIDNQ